MLDIATKQLVNLELLAGEVPSVVRWSPRKPCVVAIGYKSGRLSFVEINIQKSFSIEMYAEQEDMIREVLEDMFLTEEEKKDMHASDQSAVVDLAWDQGEDHLIVSYANGGMGMLDFGGF